MDIPKIESLVGEVRACHGVDGNFGAHRVYELGYLDTLTDGFDAAEAWPNLVEGIKSALNTKSAELLTQRRERDGHHGTFVLAIHPV